MLKSLEKVGFSYTDEFGQETKVSKSLTNAYTLEFSTLEMLVEEFKTFLLYTSFDKELVDRIIITE